MNEQAGFFGNDATWNGNMVACLRGPSVLSSCGTVMRTQRPGRRGRLRERVAGSIRYQRSAMVSGFPGF